MINRVTATVFARGLSEFLNRVRYGRESFVVERGGVEVCEVRPVGYASTCTATDLVELLRKAPHPGDEYLTRVDEAVKRQPRAEDTRWER